MKCWQQLTLVNEACCDSIAKLLNQTKDIPGQIAEIGVFRGGMLKFMFIKDERIVNGFDTFAGLTKPDKHLDIMEEGSFAASLEEVEAEMPWGVNLYKYDITRVPKIILEGIRHTKFSFVHIDVDLYHPTLAAWSLFYPQVPPGGIIVCDDYNCPKTGGAKKATDRFLKGKETIIEGPKPQIYIVKQ